ncbi:MAG: hypothetical protein RPR98_07395 [Bermanella sp.]
MKNIITNMALVGLLSALAACGGSSDAAPTTTGSTPDDTPDAPDTPVDPIADVASDKIGLGSGVGDSYENGVASTALGANESLSASGSTTVSVNIVNLDEENAEFLGLRNVYFLSTCTQVGLAEFTPATLQASGEATATYKDKGCGKELGATDNVVVYIGTEDSEGSIIADATARTTIDVEAAQVGAIQFVSASPNLIALNGFGTEATPALSDIQFKVVDESGNPMPDRTVNFALDHEYGRTALSLATAITDQEGVVSVILNAGNASGTMRVKAGVDIKDASGTVTSTITTMSIPITMATSLADQNSSGMAMDVRNPSAWGRDGEEVNVTVHLGDHYQNPVIDGTTVYFRASGGIIEPQCETSSGFCSVKWLSANPRPVDGYVTVVAYTRGQGSYQDDNSDGLFNLGENFTAFGEEYVDANGNGSFDQGGSYQPDLDIDDDGINDFSWPVVANFYEEFIDSNNNSVLDEDSGSLYQGVNCAADALAAGHCAEQIDIVLSGRLQMSQSNSAYIEGPFLWSDALDRYDTSEVVTCVDASSTGGSQAIAWRVADSSQRRNHLPQGSKVSLQTNDVDVLSTNADEIESAHPVAVLSVWESATGAGNGLDDELKRYHYLAQRGHLFSASILRPENLTTITGVGTITLEVDTNHGPTIASNSLDVDLLGSRIILSSASLGIVDSIDVSDGAQNFTLLIQNYCENGLSDGELLITTSNGLISAADAQGGASSASISDNVLTASIDNTGAPTLVTFTLTKDAVSGGVAESNALNITHRVPHAIYPDILIPTELADYSVKD